MKWHFYSLLTSLFIMCFIKAESQSSTPSAVPPLQQPALIYPPYYVRFYDGIPQLLNLPQHSNGYTGSAQTYCSNIVLDYEGRLKFFVIDASVFDKEGKLVATLSGHGHSEISVIPLFSDNFDCNSYGVFAVRKQGLMEILEFHVLEINVTASNQEVYQLSGGSTIYNGGVKCPVHFSIGPLVLESGDWIRYIYTANCDNILSFRFNNSDLTITQIYNSGALSGSTPGGMFTEYNLRSEVELAFSPSGQVRIAVPFYYDNPGIGYSGWAIFVQDFNSNGTPVSGTDKVLGIGNFFPRGIEFSPSGKLLYYSTNQTGVNYIPVTSPFPTSNFIPTISSDFYQTQIEKGYPIIWNGSSIDRPLLFASGTNIGFLEDADDPFSTFHSSMVSPVSLGLTLGSSSSLAASGFDWSIRPLNDQVDGTNCYDPFVYPEFASCCNSTIIFDEIDLSVTSTSTWTSSSSPFPYDDNKAIIKNSLRITSGTHLKISNMNFLFGENAKIIVERGAKLSLDNCSLSSISCPGVMWNGIEVEGTQGTAHVQSTQLNSAYGIVVLNGTEISNARFGISNSLKDVTNNPIISSGGGYIQAVNSSFLNNYIDVDFAPHLAIGGYPVSISLQSNRSFFSDCEFITTQRLKDPTITGQRSRVRLVQVAGVKFFRNVFRNDYAGFLSDLERGMGIYSVDSKFLASYKCGVPQQAGTPCPEVNRQGNTFENLMLGISVNSVMPLMSPVIEYNSFRDNVRGIKLYGSQGAHIAKNSFSVGPDALPPIGSVLNTYGLYTASSSGYLIQDNDFTSDNGGEFGIYINQSGSSNNLVRNNNVTKLEIGATGAFVNFGTDPASGAHTGLRFMCNDFSNSLLVDVQVPVGGIHTNQGGCNPSLPDIDQQPSNNTLSTTLPQWGDHVVVGGAHTTYYHYPSTVIPVGVLLDPDITPGVIYKNQCLGAAFTSKIGSCPQYQYAKSTFTSNYQEMQSLKNDAQQIGVPLEQGGSQNLLTIINSSNDPGFIKNQMLQYSPYLSDEILIALINRTPTLPPGVLKLILVANSPLSQEVLEALEQISLPNGVRQQILAGQTGISQREELINQISSLEFTKDMLFDETFRHYLHDTTHHFQLDSLLYLIDFDPTLDHLAMKVSVLVLKGDYTGANQLMQTIRQQTLQYESYFKVMSALITIYNCQDKIYRVNWDMQLKDDLDLVAQDPSPKECRNAGAVLELVQQFYQPETFNYYTPGSHSMLSEDPVVEQHVQVFSVWPNPSHSYLNIQFESAVSDAVIIVYDMTGKKQFEKAIAGNVDYELLDIQELTSGVYFISIQIGNQTPVFERIIKQ